MNNILNGNEAFAALMAGKSIMCRAVGELMDFNDLDQFPATIFALSDYEFCIKRETLTLADIQFTKPAEPHDLEAGQEIFIVMPTCILRTQYDSEHGDICLSVANGFAQLDEENAKLQLQAFGKTFGNIITEIEVKDGFNDKPKKPRSSRSKKNEPEQVQTESVKPTGTESTDEPWGDIETDSEKLVEKFTAQIVSCASTNAVLSLRNVFMSNGNLEREQHQYLCRLTEEKLLELDPEQYAPKIEQLEPNLTTFDESVEYQTLLNDLINRAQEAKTPAEATALTGYTKAWTEIQRKPLIDAIHKRLVELNPEASTVSETPSLMVQIQTAHDLTTLDTLEIDVAGRHPDIQPRLMGYVRARLYELENSGSKVVP